MESLAYVFEDTQKRLLEDRRLYDLTSRAVMCTLLYAENITDTRVFGNYYTNIQVTNNTVLNEAERLSRIYPKVAVLNCGDSGRRKLLWRNVPGIKSVQMQQPVSMSVKSG